MSPVEEGYDDQFDALYELAYRVAFRILGSREDADDVAGETMAKAWLRWARITPYARTWVARVSGNAAVSVLRRRSVRDRLPLAPPRFQASSVEVRRDLVRALRRLSKRQREVVVLRYLADLPEDAVATALGCSVGTVKQHAHRGLNALQLDVDLVEGTN